MLETHATIKEKQETQVSAGQAEPAEPIEAPQQLTIWHESKKPRPRQLKGYTYNISTPVGKTFVTINENGGDQPFEVFINTAKAGSETAAVSEAIGRLISYILRLASPIAPRDRLKEVLRQLSGIGGGRSLGFGPNRVRSLPDGVAHAVAEYLENTFLPAHPAGPGAAPAEAHGEAHSAEIHLPQGNGKHSSLATAQQPSLEPPPHEQPVLQIGDLCPECGQAAVVNEEGCRKCYACGYSEC